MPQVLPGFSIVIPCYNQGPFLRECLDSVLQQTLPAHEIIAVDDGSTDPFTVRRLDELCQGPVQLLRQENHGLAGARNSGVRRSTGDWIVPLDADDRLRPDALQSYAEAIAREPEVDVWYPDIQHFGLDTSLWIVERFNPWRELWANHLVCSSAIRRRIFDSGLCYDERMRLGYEDWEFYIRACCQAGFVARPLRKAVFYYRRWGYSMISATNARALEVIQQIHELPIYHDKERLLGLKRACAPYLAVAAQSSGLSQALAAQEFQDYRVVDETGQAQRDGDLRVFRGQLGRLLLVGLADAPLGAALRADPYLLEKIAHTYEAHQPALLSLLTVADAGTAYPGHLIRPEAGAAGPADRCVAVLLRLEHLLHNPAIPRTSAGLLADLLQHAGGNVLHMIVGRTEGGAGVPLPVPPFPSTPAALDAQRAGPVDPEEAPERRGGEWWIARETPRFTPTHASDAPGLLLAVPWIVHGGVDRAAVDLFRGLRRQAPDLRTYLLTTQPVRMVWADEVMPHVRGVFSLPDLAPENPGPFLRNLAARLNIGTFLIANSQAGFDALPALRQGVQRLRVIAHCHVFDYDPGSGEPVGHPAYAATRYNNLIDGYAVISEQVGRLLCEKFYVSPSKVRVIRTGIDVGWFAQARRRRFSGDGPFTVLWLGRIAPEKDPEMVLAVARLWRQRHGTGRLRFVLAGGEVEAAQELSAALRRRWQEEHIGDLVTLFGPVDSPLPLYRAADCVMLTSRYEGMPLVIREAMAAGLPVLTPVRNTAIAEELPPDVGYFIDDRSDPEEYVRVLERMLADPGEARARAAGMIALCDSFSSERYVAQMLDYLCPGRAEAPALSEMPLPG